MSCKRVPIFVPHVGCPGMCSFCDQRHISGAVKPPTPEEARKIAEDGAGTLPPDAKAQIAFFGGSFTAMDRGYMVSLLEAVRGLVESGAYAGIRISTRPDAIDPEILDILKLYRVTDIELGAQSMCDEVLAANLRGHTAADTRRASALIRRAGFGLGLQMMTGLYKDTDEHTQRTAQDIIDISPDTVRIYPALVIRGTLLHKWFESGKYRQQELEEAVKTCAGLIRDFEAKDIKVIKVGLQDSPELRQSLVAGPYHPAFRELCESRLMLDEALCQINRRTVNKAYFRLRVAPSCVSKMAGQRRANLAELRRLGLFPKIAADPEIPRLKVKIEEVDYNCVSAL